MQRCPAASLSCASGCRRREGAQGAAGGPGCGRGSGSARAGAGVGGSGGRSRGAGAPQPRLCIMAADAAEQDGRVVAGRPWRHGPSRGSGGGGGGGFGGGGRSNGRSGGGNGRRKPHSSPLPSAAEARAVRWGNGGAPGGQGHQRHGATEGHQRQGRGRAPEGQGHLLGAAAPCVGKGWTGCCMQAAQGEWWHGRGAAAAAAAGRPSKRCPQGVSGHAVAHWEAVAQHAQCSALGPLLFAAGGGRMARAGGVMGARASLAPALNQQLGVHRFTPARPCLVSYRR